MEFRDTDIVIIVTGPVGSGKSTFINALLPKHADGMRVGGDLSTCTSDISCTTVELKSCLQCPPIFHKHRVVLVDTPGFDNPGMADRTIIAKIKLWLRKSYPAGKPRGGLIYMRDGKTPTSDAALAKEAQLMAPLKLAFRDELCFVMTKGEELTEQQRSRVTDRLAAQDHIKRCINGQSDSCAHRVWQPINTLLARAERQLLPDDVVLLITGLTGCGKSTFVNTLSDEPDGRRMNVGATGSLLPCTTRLDYSIISLKERGYRLVVVDTPGFDNPNKPFMSILEEILSWLRESFPRGRCQGGIVYLHDITLNRFQAGPEIKPLGASLQWGKQKLHVLTTKWSLLTSEEVRSNMERRVNECATPLSDSVEVHHCWAEEDGMKIVNRVLPDVEEGTGFTFHQAVQASNLGSSRKSYEISIAALITLIKALLRLSRDS